MFEVLAIGGHSIASLLTGRRRVAVLALEPATLTIRQHAIGFASMGRSQYHAPAIEVHIPAQKRLNVPMDISGLRPGDQVTADALAARADLTSLIPADKGFRTVVGLALGALIALAAFQLWQVYRGEVVTMRVKGLGRVEVVRP